MSRLDLFIDRMVSQRVCLEFAAAATEGLQDPVFELGLGNGRTRDHLREILPGCEIFVFERAAAFHPDSTPEGDVLPAGREDGDIAAGVGGVRADGAFADMGGHDAGTNDAFARRVSPLIEPLLAVGGLVVSSDRTYFEDLVEQPLPRGAVPGRCFLCRREGPAAG